MKNYLITLAALSLTLMSCNNQKQAKTVTLGPNPFITHMYTADPSAHVWEDGRLYVYASHDIDPPRGCDLMDRYHVFSTNDMVNWTDHGEILNSSQVSWGRKDGGFMWAPDCAYSGIVSADIEECTDVHFLKDGEDFFVHRNVVLHIWQLEPAGTEVHGWCACKLLDECVILV